MSVPSNSSDDYPARIVRRVVRLGDGAGPEVVSLEQFRSSVFLAFLFVASFALPFLFGLKTLREFAGPTEPAAMEDELFPKSVNIQGQGSFVSVSPSDHLNPTKGSDYVVTAWIKPQRLPATGERMLIFAKAENKPPVNPGFSLSLMRSGSEVRPVVYWKDPSGQGGWYRFGEFKLLPRQWVLLILSLRDDRLLGVHVAPVVERRPRLQLLGGYELERPLIPSSGSPFIVGSLPGGSFRGRIGPIGVMSGFDLRKQWRDLSRSLTRAPQDPPLDVEGESLRLWVEDGARDVSLFGHTVGGPGPKGATGTLGEDR